MGEACAVRGTEVCLQRLSDLQGDIGLDVEDVRKICFLLGVRPEVQAVRSIYELRRYADAVR